MGWGLNTSEPHKKKVLKHSLQKINPMSSYKVREQFAKEEGAFPSPRGKIFGERVQVCTVFLP